MYYNPNEIAYCGIDKYHNKGYTGKGIKVGFFDEMPKRERAFIKIPFDKYEVDEYSHGDMTMDFLHQVAPDATVYLLPRVETRIQYYHVIDYIINEGITIINASQSGVPLTNDEINYLVSKGVKFFGAAGNGANDKIPYQEFSWLKNDNVVAVGAVHLVDGEPDWAKYSSYGLGYVDCVGFSHLQLTPIFGNLDDVKRDGTSHSTPWISGLCALYEQYYKEQNNKALSLADFKTFLFNNCTDVDEVGTDLKTGHGIFVLPEIVEKVKTLEEKLMSMYADADKISAWAKESVARATELGLINGDGTNFNPQGLLSREQAAALLIRLYDKVHAEINN